MAENGKITVTRRALRIGAEEKLRVINSANIPHVLAEGELGLALDWELSDTETGEVIPGSYGVKKSESFLQQFLQVLYVAMVHSPPTKPVSIRDTSNTLRNVCERHWNDGHILDCYEDAAAVNKGILVGTGNTAPVISNYAMETLIAHGVGAGQLQYGAVTFGAPAADAITSQCTITRNFSNGSGGPITIYEIGLACRAPDNGTQRYFLIVRDVYGAGITIPNGQTLTMNYRPQSVV